MSYKLLLEYVQLMSIWWWRLVACYKQVFMLSRMEACAAQC